MKVLSVLLASSTILIYGLTINASFYYGLNWPAIAIGDLLALNWRTQFDFDFIVHLLIVATWISWREGFTAKAYSYGFFSIFLGGMFSFPYIAYLIYSAGGNPSKLLLGRNSLA